MSEPGQNAASAPSGSPASTGTVAAATITADRLDADALEAVVMSRGSGALVTFRGVIRDHDHGEQVSALEYEAHPDAEAFLRASCERVAAASGLTVAATHRVGRLRVGEVALVAVVAAAHRAQAFAACAELVEDIKANVPIWKRQHFADGASEWVGL